MTDIQHLTHSVLDTPSAGMAGQPAMITCARRLETDDEVIGFAHIDRVTNLAGLQAEVQNLAEQPWVRHVNERDYDGDWDVLPLRCEQQHANAHPLLQAFAIEDGQQWSNLPRLQCSPVLTAILDSLKCPVKAVRLMRLRAGAEILPHRDCGLSIEYGEARLHLPVATNEDIFFTVDGSRVPMAAGELWYINADRVHAVRNQSARDRVNLVIDCLANDWLRHQIISASARAASSFGGVA